MPKKSTRRRSGKRRSKAKRINIRWLVVMAMAGLVLVGLVLLARWEERPGGVPLPVQKVSPPATRDLNHLARQEVEAFLGTVPLASPDVKRDLSTTPNHYDVQGNLPSPVMVEEFSRRLQKLSPGFNVTMSGDTELVVSIAGLTQIIVRFNPELEEIPAGPQVAIIMDDLGRGLYPARVLLSLQQPVTFSILPGETHAAEVAEMGHAAGREIMLHVPMEPQGYPAINPGDDALLTRYEEAEIRRRFVTLLAKVPHAIGANNHMGSRFTEDQRALAVVMEIMAGQGLFFVDSLTTGGSKATLVANRLHVPNLKRDVFLDNVAEVEVIKREVFHLANLARKNNYAIGICHPYPETLEALRQALPALEEQGVEVVPVTTLLKRLPG